MALYETVFIARQDITPNQVEALANDYEKIVKDFEGSVAKREYWGLRTLAYEIEKNKKGHYVLFNFDVKSEAIAEMERQMGLNDDVIRFMTITVDEFEEGPSVVMASSKDD